MSDRMGWYEYSTRNPNRSFDEWLRYWDDNAPQPPARRPWWKRRRRRERSDSGDET